MTAAARDRFRADHLGIIFQQFNLLPYLSVIDNIRYRVIFLPVDANKRAIYRAHPRIIENTFTIARKRVSAPGNQELSVGQQQRVAVTRALMGNPELILADEPTSSIGYPKPRQPY